MIKARHNKLYTWFFWSYFNWMRRLHFRKMTVMSEVNIPDHQSILLFQNHFSWWDGYWSYALCRNVFKRKFHVMMLEEQLRKRMFLNRCGIYSIRKNNRDFLDSLTYTTELLDHPKNLVTIYPSGSLLTQHQQNVPFQRGIDLILKGVSSPFAIVLAVVLIDYFSSARPEIRIYLQNYSGEKTAKAIENAYHVFYQSCISKQTE